MPVLAGDVIARIVGYAIVTLGFVLAFEALGFSLGPMGSLLIIVIVLGAGSAYAGSSLAAASSGWMIPVLPVLELMGLSMVASLWYRIRVEKSETHRTRKALEKYSMNASRETSRFGTEKGLCYV